MGPDTTNNYSIHIDGNIQYGIPDFEADCDQFLKESVTIKKIDEKNLSFECEIKFDKWKFFQSTGITDWMYLCCPNRRVAHLMMFGKNKKIRHKNFNRAAKIIGRIL